MKGGVEETFAEFRAGLGGELILPGDPGYEDARRVWNAMIDRHPSMIVRCAGVSDVLKAVNFAREHGLRVAVRGGGHNVSGNAVCDDGMVIDLSRMKGIWMDPMALTVRAQAGVTWGELDRETMPFGLATTGGVVSTTGIAGLTLGGGIGWLMRKHGLACDNLVSVDIITADGRPLRADARHNPDLFWGVRGGGGNFGIVTSFEYRLHPVSRILAGMVVHPMDRAREVLRFYRGFARAAPDELTAYAALLSSPEGVPIVAIIVAYFGLIEEGEKLVRPLREFGPPLFDGIRPIAYVDFQRGLDAAYRPGFRNYWKSNFLAALTDEALETIVHHCAKFPSRLSGAILEHLGGAVARVGEGETAFANRDAEFNFTILSMWSDPAEDEVNKTWARELWNAMQPFSSGRVYVNYLGEEGEERVRAAYGPNYERLVALKQRYDPKNFFGHNQNIRPFAK